MGYSAGHVGNVGQSDAVGVVGVVGVVGAVGMAVWSIRAWRAPIAPPLLEESNDNGQPPRLITIFLRPSGDNDRDPGSDHVLDGGSHGEG